MDQPISIDAAVLPLIYLNILFRSFRRSWIGIFLCTKYKGFRGKRVRDEI